MGIIERSQGICRINTVTNAPGYRPGAIDRSKLVAGALLVASIHVISLVSIRAADAQQPEPPRVRHAQRFLAQRGFPRPTPTQGPDRPTASAEDQAAPSAAAQWQPLGLTSVSSLNFGLTTGRITSLALDPDDTTGNRLYAGTTGGGVWVAQNAATSSADQIVFTPLTDTVLKQPGLFPPSISIGALSVQPGATGVILAGTGDPNDALDSYYGAGILRSTDSGQTWTLIQQSVDLKSGQSQRAYAFVGEGIAGFAWSTVSPQTVVTAVSHAYEATLVDARWDSESYGGLYYSNDSGASWHLSRIIDLNGKAVQGPTDAWAGTQGNAATAVVWNPVRKIFLAAVRFHGYYESSDGTTWTRLANQPGSGLTTTKCPTNSASTGSTACPIFRGALAVNPNTGDTFAWTVDLENQDQGIWQDVCSATAGSCSSSIAFDKQWNTTAMETNTSLGAATVVNGDHNLAFAAVPSGQDTLLFAGANDLWKCSLAAGCTWRNATSSQTCMSAKVGAYQHALEWSAFNPLELFVGNDYGLWRSMDAVGDSDSSCVSSDAGHFQNLNGSLGSLAEIESMAVSSSTPYMILAGLGVNGAAGVRGTTSVTANWPELLSGEGGSVAIDPKNTDTWYVNNGAGVSIHACTNSSICSPVDFGRDPVIGNTQVSNDGLTMTASAPFLVDPADPTQLLIGTCRVWRGPASGKGWTSANAITSILDGNATSSSCDGNALIRSMTAIALADGGEVVYAGMYGSLNGGTSLPGHVLRGVMTAKGAWTWQDLTTSPVDNDIYGFNAQQMDVSNIFIDTHDPTGNTVYVTIAGMPDTARSIRTAYRSIDGGVHWTSIDSNLPWAPAGALVIDPGDADIAYLASDDGVFVTTAVSTCGQSAVNCWSAYGAGLPQSPVVALNISGNGQVLVAGTYGRGVWQIPLSGAGPLMTSGNVNPSALTFSAQLAGTTSAAQTVVVSNTGNVALALTSIRVSGDFSETDNCMGTSIAVDATCTVQIAFTPAQAGSRTGNLTIAGNLSGGSIVVPLSGTGLAQGIVSILPASLDFGSVEVGSSSTALPLTVENSTANAVGLKSVTVSGPFIIADNVCGTTSLIANSDCQISVKFSPTSSGPATGSLTLVDDTGTQTAQLAGTGTAQPTDTLSPGSLTFSGTIIGQTSLPQTVTLTNSGGNALISIQESVSGPFKVSSTCTTQLIGGASCAMTVTFQPTAQGTQTGTLTVSDIMRTQTVSLTGTGLLPPTISVSPPSLNFGGQIIAATSAPLSVTIANSGGAPMANVGFQITGSGGSSFAVAGTTCGARLDENGSCTAQITFSPSSTGAANATLTVSSSTLGVTPVTVALSGTGQTAASLTVNPSQLTFAALPVGQTSVAQFITITNTGGNAATGLSLAVSGPFSLAQNTCGTSLAAGVNCTVAVIFAPSQKGAASGTLTVTSPGLSATATVALVGTGGLVGVLHIEPAVISFPTTGVDTTSSAVTVTLTNSSANYPLTDLQLVASTGFQISNNTCAASLAANASCTAGLIFAPSQTGKQTGALTVTSSTLASNLVASLSGEGYDYAVTAGTNTASVVSGQTANYTFTLTPAAGAGGTFTFQCNSLPQYAACLFTPSSNTIAANASGSEIVQITTSQASASALPASFSPWRVVPALCGILLLPIFLRRRTTLLRMIAMFAIAIGIASCASSGGGGGSTPQNPTTHMVAAGTYSIPVVVKSSGLQHTVTLILKVN